MLSHPMLQGRSRGNDAENEDSGVTDGQSGCTCGFGIPDSWAGTGKWGGVEDQRGAKSYKSNYHFDAGAHSSFAAYSGTSERLRPILISTPATIAGLLPIALNLNGLSTEDGIAIAIIGGLIVSTALPLFVVPLITWRPCSARASRTAESALPASFGTTIGGCPERYRAIFQ